VLSQVLGGLTWIPLELHLRSLRQAAGSAHGRSI
jgi:hypothetical protein